MPARDTSGGLLTKICASFRPYLQELWRDINFGLCRSKVDIEKLKCSSSDRNTLADQFTLVLPYAGSHLRWEVIFDAIHPYFAPDFRFDDESFLTNVTVEYIENNVPSLANWDADNPKALSNVITELMSLYRDHQKLLLCEDENSRAYFEYTALIGDSLTPENDVEILVGKGESVNFMIKLNIEESHLPSLFPEELTIHENPGGECAVILVKYPNPNKADLIMSPLVSKVVGDIDLPPMHPTGVLMDYVPTVTDIINNKIISVYQNEKLRQQVISRFIVKYEGCVLEHDSTKATFLLHLKDFYCILQIEIEDPKNPPVFTVRSIYHRQEGRPRFKILTSTQQYENLEEYITQEIEIFQLECTGETSENKNLE